MSVQKTDVCSENRCLFREQMAVRGTAPTVYINSVLSVTDTKQGRKARTNKFVHVKPLVKSSIKSVKGPFLTALNFQQKATCLLLAMSLN